MLPRAVTVSRLCETSHSSQLWAGQAKTSKILFFWLLPLGFTLAATRDSGTDFWDA
jgi:hypothetical protein